ncbi:hypothetical protein N9917_03185 [Deltaproteobacteria bacterium]|nr:hypothetical protein [Deltaproteobacteria bacterium]
MAVCFNQGEVLGRGDLDIFLTNSAGGASNAYAISYAIYWVDPTTGAECLIGGSARTPMNPAVGEYFGSLQIPPNATVGDYRIRWTFVEFAGAPSQQVVQEFGVVGQTVQTTATTLSKCEQDLIRKFRIMIRDNNPDRNYRFRPPEGEGEVGCYNQVFGFIWEDEELLEYMRIALDKFNMFPPNTQNICTLDMVCQKMPSWRSVLLWGGIVNAAMALAFNWTADEFDYSIGGISLNIDKSSKYMSLKENAESQFDKMAEAKARTVKFIKGLSQPRFGRGVRSAFGPHVGKGVLSPRRFF